MRTFIINYLELLKALNLKINVKYIIKSNGGIYNASGINLSEILKVIDENINILMTFVVIFLRMDYWSRDSELKWCNIVISSTHR